MLHVQCPGCMTSAYIDCTCPPGHAANVGAHHPECAHASIDAQVKCNCCPEGHDHAAAANACPGGHDAACPDAADCATWKGAMADTRHPAYDGEPAGDCPGGHCHKDLDGCGVCRPLIVTVLPGSATIQTVGA